jgi:ribonucleoside-diphosphate reductase alpha chain
LWLGLNWQHEDIRDFARAKDYPQELIDMNNAFPDLVKLPFDHTNMSILWDDAFYDEFAFTDDGLLGYVPELWYESVELMCRTGEPGHCYNFGENSDETGRNACTEFITDRDSDSCNLGSLNFSRITSKEELKDVTNLAAKFLVCGSIRGDTPNQACKETKEMARKIGLGIMGLHEWLLTRGYGYEVTAELHEWLGVYQHESERASCEHSERFFISPPTKFRSLAPTGTIGIIAGTSQGIEPLFGTAYKRRYRADGDRWAYQYEVSPVAKFLIEEHGVKEEDIETAVSLSENVEKRIRFQAELQSYIDMGISSTINLPAWGTESNNPDTAKDMSRILLRYCGNLRGITVYPDGARGFQPVTACTIEEAEKHSGIVYAEEDQCKSGVCGI